MEIQEISSEIYNNVINDEIAYNKQEFILLNSYKVMEIKYFLFYAKKKYFAMALGVDERGNAYIPFSAPFSSLETLRKKWSLESLDEAINCFDDFANHKYKQVLFILPPEFYNHKLILGSINALIRCGYSIHHYDLNFALKLDADDKYKLQMNSNGRKNLKLSFAYNLIFVRCFTNKEKEMAYRIIETNRRQRGYPLRMSWRQVMDTIKVVNDWAFLVKYNNQLIASAIVFQVNDNVVQVIYWGSDVNYNSLKPINFLAYKLREFFLNAGFKYLDIGPSSKDGIPNWGLCDFKESIGCEMSSKISLLKVYNTFDTGLRCNMEKVYDEKTPR